MAKDINKNINNSEVFICALKNILKPLVKLLITVNITFPAIAKILKSLYVEVAYKDFKIEEKKQTDSRINLLTGVHRKDVKKLKTEIKNNVSFENSELSFCAVLIANWLGNKNFSDEKNNAIPLDVSKGDKSFKNLVETISKDIRPRAVLDDMLSRGMVEIKQDEKVYLNKEAYIPSNDTKSLAEHFSKNVSSHINSCINNMLNEEQKFIERALYFDELTQENINELNELTKEKGQKLLEEINKKAFEMANKNKNNKKANKKIAFGVYFHAQEKKEQKTNDE